MAAMTFPHAMAPSSAPARSTTVAGLRIAGIVLQALLAVLATGPLLVGVAFVLAAPAPVVAGVIALLAALAVWFLAGPFLYALITRATGSVAWTVLAFLGCGPAPFVIVWALGLR
ncbi:hypothetical protein SAMN05443637_105123 [Pseudonocardia thermophila]|uniref:Uncharacterized protein n=2 Tax=Pseudonocardia thermophila TaxID=1848 RepID=A0A1M6RRM7_PSETH|nr:hypothetical protein SAMN05443637_105123 [Pseudonocardia thermophila]